MFKPALRLLRERRGAPRYAADCSVVLSRTGGSPLVGPGRMIDWSASGFRVSHSLQIKTGDFVEVITPQRTAHTRVVWNLTQDGVQQAGLVLVSRQYDAKGRRLRTLDSSEE